MIDPLVTLKLLDASAATAAARQVVRTGPSLHDGLAAEGSSLKDSRLRALAAAQDTSMVRTLEALKAALKAGMTGQHEQVACSGQEHDGLRVLCFVAKVAVPCVQRSIKLLSFANRHLQGLTSLLFFQHGVQCL